MSADIHVIPSMPEGVSVLELLREMTERAEAGEFSSIMCVYVTRDGCTGNGWSKLHSAATMIGALALSQRDIMS